MNIDKLARKLKPLMPEEVEHWLRSRDMVDAETADLIEKEITWHAYDKLGDFRNKPLLSLPSKTKAKGLFHLGTVLYEKEKWPCGINTNEILQNLAIFGRSGAGKTNVAFHLLEQLVQQKVPFPFLDWKRTARHLLPILKAKVNIYTPGRSLSPFIFNSFIPPPGLEHNIYINHLVDVMAEAFTLGDGARSVLRKTIATGYKQGRWPNATDVLHEVEKMTLKGRAHGWRVSAQRALESLSFAERAPKETSTQQELVDSFLKQNTIIELDALDQGNKKFLIPLLCLWLYYVRLVAGDRETLNLVIVVEEAHHVLYRQEQRAKETVMNMLLRQCREIGIGIVVIDQHPHLISSAVLGNVYTSICLNHKDPSDINRAAGLSLVDEEDKRWFSMLPVGQGIVKLQDRWHKPFLVQFPLVQIKKGLVTDHILEQLLTGAIKPSYLRSMLAKELGRAQQTGARSAVLSEEEFIFLHDVMKHENDGVDIRYKRLGWSADKGHKLKELLLDRGWLEQEVVKIGRTRKVLLRATIKAREALDLGAARIIQRGSLVHEYWKRFYARVFQEQGYRVELEAARKGGRVDVLATRTSPDQPAERVAIEVETGKSNVVENVTNNLLSKVDKVVVVATDKAALAKVEVQLAKARLIIPSRVKVVLRDELKAA